jgi:hypothetical protein
MFYNYSMSALNMVFGLFLAYGAKQPIQLSVTPYICADININSKLDELGNITCSQCIDMINVLKNETVPLMRFASKVEHLCDEVYGPNVSHCVNLTQSINQGMHYLNITNTSTICKELNYC